MIKNYLEYYKRDVKGQYEIAKKGGNSSLLINPSRAKLRKLCLEIFKNNTNSDDLKVFSFFFGFEFNPENTNKLKENTDRFRPIETFFKGETDLNEIEAVNLAAILVNFKNRPYLKYLKTDVEKKNEDLVNFEEKKNSKIEEEIKPQIPSTKYESMTGFTPKETTTKRLIDKKTTIKRKLQLAGISSFLIFFTFLGIKLTTGKDCLLWKENHYEKATTEEASKMNDGAVTLITEENEYLLNSFRKIEPCDTTTYFKNGKPCIWYWKSPDNKIECFTGPGFHPENGKNLRPITQHMIDKYIIQK